MLACEVAPLYSALQVLHTNNLKRHAELEKEEEELRQQLESFTVSQ